MDLVPKPDQVVSAATNLLREVVYGGLADLRPMPRDLVDEGVLREVYHYRPSARVRDSGDPVLLVTPLAAPALCYDLRRGGSLVEHLVEVGRPTYLVEYGAVSFEDRELTIAPWVDDVVPAAVRAASAHAGDRPVHLVGWSLGGTFALLAAAADPGLPIASVTALGTPFDLRDVPLVAPPRPLLTLPGQPLVLSRVSRAVAAQPWASWTAGLSSFQRLVAKPLALARNLDDADYLAQLQAVERFSGAMSAYRGRTYGQLYHRLVPGNALAGGALNVGDRSVSLARVKPPVLLVGGAVDQIAPVGAVKSGVPLLTGSEEVRFEIVPGGHLGMLAGREARDATWPVVDAWVEEWTRAPAVTPRRSSKRATQTAAPKKPTAKKATPTKATVTRTALKKSAAQNSTAKKAAAKKAAAKKATTKRATARRTTARGAVTAKAAPRKRSDRSEAVSDEAAQPAIGANPTRRYGSAGSRSLRR